MRKKARGAMGGGGGGSAGGEPIHNKMRGKMCRDAATWGGLTRVFQKGFAVVFQKGFAVYSAMGK